MLSLHLGCGPFGTEWVYWIAREWNAAADSLATEDRARQDDINILELKAVQTAAGLILAVRAGEAKQATEIRADDFTRSELRTLKTKVAATRTAGRIAADKHICIKRTALGMGPPMQQCLAILLFHECSTLLEL